MPTTSFFYSPATGLEPNTVDALLDTLNQKVSDADASKVAAQEAQSLAEAAAALAGSAEAPFTQAGTGATVRTVQLKLQEFVSVKDFGAVGDGTTDDRAAFANALTAAAGKILYIPKGTYRIAFTGTTALTIPANTTLLGEGKGSSILSFVPDSSTFRNFFAPAGNGIQVRNLGTTCVVPSGGSVVLFSSTVSDVVFDNCDLDGRVTNSGSTISHSAYLFSFPTTAGTQEDYTLSNSDIRRWSFGFLKTNTSVSTQRRITVSNCDCYSNYKEVVSFNSPAGVMEDIQIKGTRFRDCLGPSASLTSLHVAFASVDNFRVEGCHFSGSITDAIHIEEDSSNGVVVGNTFEVNGNGIVVQDNNVGGTSLMPKNLSITGNTLRKSGTSKESGKYGIWLVNDATPEVPAKRVVVVGNTVEGFDRGVVTGVSTDDACDISSNIAHDCNIGFWTTVGNLAIDRNTSSYCGVGMTGSSGGVCNRHRFVECTVAVDAATFPVLVIDPSFEWEEFTSASAGNVNKNMFALGSGDRIYADVIMAAGDNVVADTAHKHSSISWDGTTFPAETVRYSYNGGGVFVLSCVNNSGNVAVRLFSASSRTPVRLVAHLRGSITVAV